MDFSKIDDDLAKEIVRGGEAYLDGQAKIAASADSRSAGLAGIYTAAAMALIAGTIALTNPAWNVPGHTPMMAGGVVSAACFLTGAILCIVAIQPTAFWLAGCEPENWAEDIASGRKLRECLGDRALHIQEEIAENTAVITKNARLFKWGSTFGILAPVAGLVVWLTAHYVDWLIALHV